MSEITDLGSPDRDLSARDIKRKKGKLKNVIEKLKNPNLSGKRRHNLEFKKEKTLDQITTGKSGIRPIKQPYEGLSRKSSSPINDLMKDGKPVPSTEGVYRKSALNMLGVQSKSPLNDMTQQESELTKEQKEIVASYRNEFFQDSEIDLREQLMTDKEILTIDSLKQNMPKNRAGIRENIKMQHEIMKPLWNLKNK